MGREWTDEQKERASKRQRAYWNAVEKFAAEVEIDKIHLHCVWSGLLSEGTIRRGRSKDPNAIEQDGFILIDPERAREVAHQHAENDAYDEDDPLHERVKMALWLIRKCGGVAEAEDAIRRAKKALK